MARAAPAATILGVAALLALAVDAYLNYDARYALLWARDLVGGAQPDFTADFAPTPHPLETWVSVLATPFGDAADTIMLWLVLLCFGLLVWLTYRLGATLFNPAAGIVAALVVASRPALLRDALIGYQDIAFACAIVGAALLEVKRPRRGEAVLALLALAGLMRPEGWALAGLYALWMLPGSDGPRRARLLGLAALAPLLWLGFDWAVTGDPLHSLHGTADLAEAVDRRRDPVDAPYWAVQYLGFALREPIVLGLPFGLYLAWRLRIRGALVPLALVAVMIAVFMVGPFFGLPLIGRYMRTAAVLLALFYGLAVAGFLLLEPGRERRIWTWIGGALAAASLLFLPWHAGMLEDVRDRIERRAAVYDDLEAIARDPAVERAVERCPRVSVAEHRTLPHLRWWLDLPPFAVSTPEGGASRLQDVLLTARDTRATRFFYGRAFPRLEPPADQERVAANPSWRITAAAACA